VNGAEGTVSIGCVSYVWTLGALRFGLAGKHLKVDGLPFKEATHDLLVACDVICRMSAAPALLF